MTDKQKAWIAVAAQSLRDNGSWTGRTHLHKHLFVLHVLGLAEVPFDFELYHYGPYSFALDAAVAEMETYGDLDKEYRKRGYGPSYAVTELGEDAIKQLSLADRQAAKRVAKHLKNFDSSDLELIATCLWVERSEGITDPELSMPRIQEIKPKYSLGEIQVALKQAHGLIAALAK
jgi:uncharacterized protein YwgA